jgi:hypothetical protein
MAERIAALAGDAAPKLAAYFQRAAFTATE